MTSQIKIVLTSFFYLVVLNSFSQTITNRNELGWGHGDLPSDKGYIEGTRYLHDDFRNGDVFYDGNSKSLQLPLRLNLHNDEFEYMENDSVFAFAEPSCIDKVIMEDDVFIYIDKSEGGSGSVFGFVELRNTKLPCILTKMKIDFYKKVISNSPTVKSESDRFVRDDDSNYLMKTETDIINVTSVKELINLLDDHSQELTDFAKEAKISNHSRNGEDMARILDYYHTLGHDL
jgi:hypothetical protein